jgi:hypothetical protein
MTEPLDLETIKWGDLEKRIEQDPELLKRPELQWATAARLAHPFTTNWKTPRFDWPTMESMAEANPPYTLPELPPGIGRNAVHEVELASLRAEVRKLREAVVHTGPARRLGKKPAPKKAEGQTHPVGTRPVGRPSYNDEIVEIFYARWPGETFPPHSLAEEAKQVLEELKARHPGPVQYGQSKIPKQASMQNILRVPYSGLMAARHPLK